MSKLFKLCITSLLWENDPDCPVLTGIPIYCSLLNRLIEVHTLQKTLPDKMMNLIVKENDDRNLGQGTFNASHIIQSIQESNFDLKQSLLQTFGSSLDTNNKNLQNIINATILNPGQSSTNNNSQGSENDIQLICKDDGVWAHYWDCNLHPVPCTFIFSKT